MDSYNQKYQYYLGGHKKYVVNRGQRGWVGWGEGGNITQCHSVGRGSGISMFGLKEIANNY